MGDGQPRVLQDVAKSLLDDLLAQPRRPEPGLDVLGGQRGRLDGLEALGVDGVPSRVAGGGLAGGGEFLRTFPDRYSPAATRRPVAGVVEHEGAELRAGVGLVGAQQPGDLAEVNAPVVDQDQVQGLLRGVGAQFHPVRRGGAPEEHRPSSSRSG